MPGRPPTCCHPPTWLRLAPCPRGSGCRRRAAGCRCGAKPRPGAERRSGRRKLRAASRGFRLRAPTTAALGASRPWLGAARKPRGRQRRCAGTWRKLSAKEGRGQHRRPRRSAGTEPPAPSSPRTGPKSPSASALLGANGLMEGKTMSAKESSRTWGQRRGCHSGRCWRGLWLMERGLGADPGLRPPVSPCPCTPASTPSVLIPPSSRASIPPSFHSTPERLSPTSARAHPCTHPSTRPRQHNPAGSSPPGAVWGRARGRGAGGSTHRDAGPRLCCLVARLHHEGLEFLQLLQEGPGDREDPSAPRLLWDSPPGRVPTAPSSPILPRFVPGDTYEFCFSRCRTFLCSSWFWAVHADILGDREKGVSSGQAAGWWEQRAQCGQPGAGLSAPSWAQGLGAVPALQPVDVLLLLLAALLR